MASPESTTRGVDNPQDEVVPDQEIRVFGHTNLFYWWPVWAVGFLMAAITYFDGHVMAVVPEGSVIQSDAIIPGASGPRDVVVAPPGQSVAPPTKTNEEAQPKLRVAASSNLGVIFAGTILLCVVITNMTFRGMASIIVVAGLIVTVLVLALLHWWDPILAWLGGVDVRMNAGGYLAVAIPLFVIWLFSTFVYDHYTYLIVNSGQVRIREAIGDGEKVVDAGGLMLEKRRDDLFRHWLVGLGTGDLHVKTGGPANLDFELSNVLFLGTKLARIQDMLREKEVNPQDKVPAAPPGVVVG